MSLKIDSEGKCPVCGEVRKVYKNGNLVRHAGNGSSREFWCRGGGQKPVDTKPK